MHSFCSILETNFSFRNRTYFSQKKNKIRILTFIWKCKALLLNLCKFLFSTENYIHTYFSVCLAQTLSMSLRFPQNL